MTEFSAIAAEEKVVKPVMLSIGQPNISRSSNGNSSSNNNLSLSNNVFNTCDVCGKSKHKNFVHGDVCAQHKPSKPDAVCFWCNPDQAPDGWKPKQDAIRKKKQREKGMSTTAALHQQSGLQVPATQGGGFMAFQPQPNQQWLASSPTTGFGTMSPTGFGTSNQLSGVAINSHFRMSPQ
jgi:hypothetical protein